MLMADNSEWCGGQSFNLEAQWLRDDGLHQQLTSAALSPRRETVTGIQRQRLLRRLVART